MACKEELIAYCNLVCDECPCDYHTDENGDGTIGPCACCPLECKIIHTMLEDD
jgi:hypothetical protein